MSNDFEMDSIIKHCRTVDKSVFALKAQKGSENKVSAQSKEFDLISRCFMEVDAMRSDFFRC